MLAKKHNDMCELLSKAAHAVFYLGKNPHTEIAQEYFRQHCHLHKYVNI